MNKENVKVYCLSASDRYNYGDLLFPIVAKYHLEKQGHCNFVNVATIPSDLRSIGALETIGYDIFLDPKKRPVNSTILIAGGEVLNANWLRLLGFTKRRWQNLYDRFKGPTLERRIMKRFGLNREPIPFTLTNPGLIENNKIIYHAVGGGLPKVRRQKIITKSALAGAKYLSVREHLTQRVLKNQLHLDAQLIPDSVITYSDIVPKNTLYRQLEEGYVCVQFAVEKSKGQWPTILKELKSIHIKTGLQIAALSIGNCPGHDDIEVAKWLKENADFPISILSHECIDDITSAIAHAKLFIGTSLHGAIVSMTYCNPFVAVNKRINKLNAYTVAWAPDYLKGCVDFSDIAEEGISRLNNHYDYSKLIEQQKEVVRKSFRHIFTIMND